MIVLWILDCQRKARGTIEAHSRGCSSIVRCGKKPIRAMGGGIEDDILRRVRGKETLVLEASSKQRARVPVEES